MRARPRPKPGAPAFVRGLRLLATVSAGACHPGPAPLPQPPRPAPTVDAAAVVDAAPPAPAPAPAAAPPPPGPCAQLAAITEAALLRALPVAPHPGASALRSVAEMRRLAQGVLPALRCVEAEGAAWGFVFEAAAVDPGGCFESGCESVQARLRFGRLGGDGALTTAALDLAITPESPALPGATCCHLYGTLAVDALRVWNGADGAPRALVHVTQEGNEGHHVESVAVWRYADQRLQPVAFRGRPIFEEAVRSTTVWDAQDVDGDGLRDLLLRLPGRERCDPASSFCYLTPGPLRWARRLPDDRWGPPTAPPRGWRPERRPDEEPE